MGKIQLIIEVDEKLVCEGFKRSFTEEERNTLIRAIGNGKPLPKGHGRLIDADKLDTRERGNNSQRTMWLNIDHIITEAPTIIEAAR